MLNWLHSFHILVLFLSLAQGDETGCKITAPATGTGFNAVIYRYPLNNFAEANQAAFVNYNYRSHVVIAQASGIDDPNIEFTQSQYGPQPPATIRRTLYGQNNIPITNMVVQLEGYFYAPTSGNYVFTLTRADHEAKIFVGNVNAFSCCDANTIQGGTNAASIAYLSSAVGTANAPASGTTYLTGGLYYPIRVVFINVAQQAQLEFSITTPAGVVINSNWDSHISQFGAQPGLQCERQQDLPIATVTTPWTGKVTSTTTNGRTVIVETPTKAPYSTPTTTIPAPFDSTFTSSGPSGPIIVVDSKTPSSSYSTPTTTVPASFDSTFTSSGPSGPIIVVDSKTPSSAPHNTPTTTIPASFDSTFTSSGPSGPIIVVDSKTPSSSYSTPTTTIPASFDSTFTSSGPSGPIIVVDSKTPSSSYSTPTTTIPAPFDSTFTSSGPSGPIIVVDSKTPYQTITTPWTGTNTITTLVTNPTGPGSVVEVKTPYQTITTPWTGTNTITTLVPNPTGPGSVVEVKTPYETITTPWTGTNTITTLIPNPTGPGSVVEVKTPYQTVTIPWTGTNTITTLVSNPTGPGSIYEVKTPGSSFETTIPWTGSTTEVTTFTSDGIEWIEHKTPYQTITTSWTGLNTITTLVPNPTGPGSIYEVETPMLRSSTTTITIIKPCSGTTSSSYTTTAGCTVAVVIENPEVTVATTITDCGCTTDNTIATGTPLIGTQTLSTLALGEAVEGGASSLAHWSLAIFSPMLLMMLML